MKLKLVVIVLSLFLVACGSSKKTNYKEKKPKGHQKKRNQIKPMQLSLLQKPIQVQNISMEELLKRE